MSKELIAVIPPSGCANYLTAGREYKIQESFNFDKFGDASVKIIDDTGEMLTTRLNGSAHLNGKSFKRVEKKIKKEIKAKKRFGF